jgi:hypothetical protein
VCFDIAIRFLRLSHKTSLTQAPRMPACPRIGPVDGGGASHHRGALAGDRFGARHAICPRSAPDLHHAWCQRAGAHRIPSWHRRWSDKRLTWSRRRVTGCCSCRTPIAQKPGLPGQEVARGRQRPAGAGRMPVRQRYPESLARGTLPQVRTPKRGRNWGRRHLRVLFGDPARLPWHRW